MPRIYWLSKAFMRHPNVEIMLSSMMGKLTGYCKCQVKKNKCCAARSAFVARRGARLSVAQRRVTNREGEASGSATAINVFYYYLQLLIDK